MIKKIVSAAVFSCILAMPGGARAEPSYSPRVAYAVKIVSPVFEGCGIDDAVMSERVSKLLAKAIVDNGFTPVRIDRKPVVAIRERWYDAEKELEVAALAKRATNLLMVEVGLDKKACGWALPSLGYRIRIDSKDLAEQTGHYAGAKEQRVRCPERVQSQECGAMAMDKIDSELRLESISRIRQLKWAPMDLSRTLQERRTTVGEMGKLLDALRDISAKVEGAERGFDGGGL